MVDDRCVSSEDGWALNERFAGEVEATDDVAAVDTRRVHVHAPCQRVLYHLKEFYCY